MADNELLAYQRRSMNEYHMEQEELLQSHQRALSASTQLSGLDPEFDALKTLVHTYQTARTIGEYIFIRDACQHTLENTILSRPGRVSAYLQLFVLSRWRIEVLERGDV